MLKAEKGGMYMNLGERIALARKQAGLSQEQLGEKLRVSRQAVSKWESGQTNPDVAYVAQMCRILEVSSDWLLLGEERGQNAPPARCPGCQTIVSGLDQFCPACGRSLQGGEGYTMLLKPPHQWSADPSSDLMRLSNSGIFFKAPLNQPLSYQEASEVASHAPLVLARGLSKDQAYRAWNTTVFPTLFLFLQDSEEENPRVLARYPGIDPKTLTIQGTREPMSFGMTALAVVVGILAAVVLLMFL